MENNSNSNLRCIWKFEIYLILNWRLNYGSNSIFGSKFDNMKGYIFNFGIWLELNFQSNFKLEWRNLKSNKRLESNLILIEIWFESTLNLKLNQISNSDVNEEFYLSWWLIWDIFKFEVQPNFQQIISKSRFDFDYSSNF